MGVDFFKCDYCKKCISDCSGRMYGCYGCNHSICHYCVTENFFITWCTGDDHHCLKLIEHTEEHDDCWDSQIIKACPLCANDDENDDEDKVLVAKRITDVVSKFYTPSGKRDRLIKQLILLMVEESDKRS